MLFTYGSCSNLEFVRPGLGMGTRWAEGIPNPGPTISVCSRRELSLEARAALVAMFWLWHSYISDFSYLLNVLTCFLLWPYMF